MLFGSKKSYFLGIDFGTSLIKAVEVELTSGKPRLVNYGQVDLSHLDKSKIPAGRTYDDEITLYLRALLERFRPKSKAAYVAIPSYTGLFSLIDLPMMEESELDQAVRFEAHKYIPSDLNEVALSWEIVGEVPPSQEGETSKAEVLLVAALSKEVDRYRRYIEDSGLKMEFLELETFSLVRSLVNNTAGLELVIDIGERASNLILVENGMVKMSRNVDAGGSNITATLVDGLHVTVARAESLKKSDKDFLNVAESALIFPAFQAILEEARRMMSVYQKKYPEKSFNGIILSGGTSRMVGLTTYFSKLLQVPITIADPWSRLEYKEELADEVQQLEASFSVAIGLALAGIETITKPKLRSVSKSFSLKDFLKKPL